MIHASLYSELSVPIDDLVLAGAAIGALALSLKAVNAPARRSTLVAAVALFAAWYAAVSWLAAHGAFVARPEWQTPGLPLAVLLPVLLGVAILPRLPLATRVLDATPLSRLIAIQALRLMGVMFLIEWARGALPWEFALPAALGDMATGALAIPLARMAARQAPGARAAILSWTAFGLADFAVALGTGFLSSPGPLQLLALDRPNLLATAYPLALVPVFAVPIFTLLHLLTLWKLRRAATPQATRDLAAHPA